MRAIRCGNAYSDAKSNVDAYSNAMHGEVCTHPAASPYSGTAPVGYDSLFVGLFPDEQPDYTE